MKIGAIIGRLPNADAMVTKEEVTKELYNQGELRRTITITLKGKDLRAFATIAGRRATCPKIVGPRKKFVESNVASSNMEMEEDEVTVEDATTVEDEVNEPKTYEEASQNSTWQKAMEEEIIALEQNQTWESVPRPRDTKLISCKWAYT